MEACIKFYAVELLGEGYRGYLVTSWQIPRLGFKWKSSLGFFKDISQITGQGNIKKAYNVLAGWEKEAPDVLLAPTETQEVSETVPRNLDELVEALEKAKSQEEKSALIRSYQAFKAASPATPEALVAEAAVAEGVGIKITPEALKFFEQSLGKTAGAPFKLISFFSSPKFLSDTPQTKKALASATSLPKIAKKAEALPESERRRLLELVENLRQAEFSFFAQTKLSRRIFSVREITILMGPEVGLAQGEVAALVQGGAPPGKKPSLLGRLFGGIAQKAISKTATKAVTSALTKAGISITSEAAAATIGQVVFPIPGVGVVIGLIVNWLIDKGKDLLSWLKRNAPKVAIGLGALLFGGGFVLQSTILMGAGGALAAGGFVGQAGGVGPALSNAATGVFGALTSILSLAVASIATPLIVALISIPVIVAIILFIINSGAYIVPPKPGVSGAIESPYIGVEKEIVKVLDKNNKEINIETEEISNDRLPIKVSYKVNVKAKKGTLTNITFENICRVTKDGPPPTCTVPTPSETPDFISPVEDFVFEYEKDYKPPDYQDTFVADIFTVTADAPEQKGAVAATSAVVKVGEPPEECPHEWPIDSGYITQGAYTPSGYSHHSMEAIDIGANLRPTFAGHSGIVTKAEHSSCLGNYIEIQSICEGKSFVSQYAHLEGLGVKTGQEVVMGQTIGLSGNTGSRNCTSGPHLHYRFKYVPSGNPSFPENPPYMMKTYIPENVRRGCTNSGSCGVSI
jgi:hypothetical protein